MGQSLAGDVFKLLAIGLSQGKMDYAQMATRTAGREAMNKGSDIVCHSSKWHSSNN